METTIYFFANTEDIDGNTCVVYARYSFFNFS
jgi:hypothetical protein